MAASHGCIAWLLPWGRGAAAAMESAEGGNTALLHSLHLERLMRAASTAAADDGDGASASASASAAAAVSAGRRWSAAEVSGCSHCPRSACGACCGGVAVTAPWVVIDALDSVYGRVGAMPRPAPGEGQELAVSQRALVRSTCSSAELTCSSAE
jgi:hypothetical protein